MYIFVLKEGRIRSLMLHIMDLWKSGARLQQKSTCHQRISKHNVEDVFCYISHSKQVSLSM